MERFEARKASVKTAEVPAPRRSKSRRLKAASKPEFSEKSRVFMYEMSELFCKILPRFSELMDNDLSKLLILQAVGAANVQRLMASSQRGPYESIDVRIPPELQVPSNALSIADATGLPRETVRRKLKELLASGFVVEDDRGGYRLKPGRLQVDDLQAIYYAYFKAMVEVMEACLEAKLIDVE